MDRHLCNDRFLMHFNKACHLNPHQFCCVQSLVLRSLWLSGKKSWANTRSSSPGQKSACNGQRNTIFKWMIQMLMSSWCVSFWINICCSVALTSDLVEQSSILLCTSPGLKLNGNVTCVSLWINICCSIALTSDLVEQSSILLYTSPRLKLNGNVAIFGKQKILF